MVQDENRNNLQSNISLDPNSIPFRGLSLYISNISFSRNTVTGRIPLMVSTTPL